MLAHLDHADQAGENPTAPAILGARVWQPGTKADNRRDGGFFMSAHWLSLPMGGPVGRRASACRPFVRSANPAGSAPHLGRWGAVR